MTRKSVTTLTLSVRMRLPPGVTQKVAQDFLRRAIESEVLNNLPNKAPLKSLAINELFIRTIAKTTAYL